MPAVGAKKLLIWAKLPLINLYIYPQLDELDGETARFCLDFFRHKGYTGSDSSEGEYRDMNTKDTQAQTHLKVST